MTQKMPRNQALHERRHKRKAGPHEDRRGTRREAKDELRSAAYDYMRQTVCPCDFGIAEGDHACGQFQAKQRLKRALEAVEVEGR